MIVDSSAIAAVVFKEPGHENLLAKMASSDVIAVGAPTLVETGIVLTARLGTSAMGVLGRFVQETAMDIVPFGNAHWREAVDAFERFGKGRHPAGLNFGDCLSYATAKLSRQPLLCVGDDFARTDLDLADW